MPRFSVKMQQSEKNYRKNLIFTPFIFSLVIQIMKKNFYTILEAAGIRVLVMTGFDTLEHREQLQQAGADGYLPKPIGKEVLLEKVQTLLSTPANS